MKFKVCYGFARLRNNTTQLPNTIWQLLILQAEEFHKVIILAWHGFAKLLIKAFYMRKRL